MDNKAASLGSLKVNFFFKKQSDLNSGKDNCVKVVLKRISL